MVFDNSIPVSTVAALTLKQRDVIESALQILQAIKDGDGDYWGKLDETIAALDETLHLPSDSAAQLSRAEVLEEAATICKQWAAEIDTGKKRNRVVAAAMQGALTCAELIGAFKDKP